MELKKSLLKPSVRIARTAIVALLPFLTAACATTANPDINILATKCPNNFHLADGTLEGKMVRACIMNILSVEEIEESCAIHGQTLATEERDFGDQTTWMWTCGPDDEEIVTD